MMRKLDAPKQKFSLSLPVYFYINSKCIEGGLEVVMCKENII